ncbi:MAG: NADH-quinone oxidoreductase subunit L [Thermoguttaceae bacterium]
MNLESLLPSMLAAAWLLPLVSFALIVFFGPRMGRGGRYAAHVATTAIIAACVLSFACLGLWLAHYPLTLGHGSHAATPPHLNADWYSLGEFGSLKVTVGYYIDALTLCMFCMVTLVASCIHVYSSGYMHGELSDVFDTFGPTEEGRTVRRRGRYHRFFQCLSLFCFSMLGLVIAGNVAMVFVFWELVGICSYLLIGFWHERKSASNAANKAFIVNRVGDFGMIVGLMAVWAGFGTFSFGDYNVGKPDGTVAVAPGIFSQVRPAEVANWRLAKKGEYPADERAGMTAISVRETVANNHQLRVPDGMVKAAAQSEIARDAREGNEIVRFVKQANTDLRLAKWRSQGLGYGLLVIAGLGIFCGCVGKSAQVPLHVWLPDAMEGPTPVSALIHAATMVAAGVYLVGRFYPVFTPEVLLVIACVGCVTLFIAATIALTATDIKRVLAYSTVSQLGFMMMALGLGGWLAGMFHLFTHAFFKSLLFLCSGSVIHACGTNEMPQMGGLRRKMPITALTMLIGCLAIAGAGIPTLYGLSGFHSKDQILIQALSFRSTNPRLGFFFYAALIGAGLTAFYMFRLWYLTFAGNPRDGHVYYHAHESPRSMTVPLMILAFLAVVAGWNIPWTNLGLESLLHQARPAGIAEGVSGGMYWSNVAMPGENPEAHGVAAPAEWAAFGVALIGFIVATLFYGLRKLDPAEVCRMFPRLYHFIARKWMFDELYANCLIRPVHRISGWVAAFDGRGIDWAVDGTARTVAAIARLDDWIDRVFVDRFVNVLAQWTYGFGLRLRAIETGNIRQYVVWIVAGTVGMFVLMSLYWNYAFAM